MKRILTLFLSCVALFGYTGSHAQGIVHLLSEGFEGVTFPPVGWIVTGSGSEPMNDCPNDSIWVQTASNVPICSVTSNPTVPSHSGNYVAGYNSWNTASGAISDLATPAQDFSSGIGYYQVTFWMWRQSGADRMDVYVNTTPSGTGANATLLGTIHNASGGTPAIPSGSSSGWYQYSFPVPATAPNNGTTMYIVFEAVSSNSWDIQIDDITVDHVLPCTIPAAQPTVLNLSSSVSIINGSFTAATSADGYLVVRTPGTTALNTPPVASTNYTTGATLGNGTIIYSGAATTFSDASLPAGTQYTYTVFAYNYLCSGGPLYRTVTPISAANSTINSIATYTWNATGSADYQVATNWTPTRTVPDPSDLLIFSNGGLDTATNVPTQSVTSITVSTGTTIRMRTNSANTLTILSDNNSATNELSVTSGSSLILDGNAGLTLAFSGTGVTNNIAGDLEVATTTGTSNLNFINFTNATTTITSTGTLAAGGSASTAPVFTSTIANLIINGTYQHKYTTTAGSNVPTATWNTGATVLITGYTTATGTIGNLGQTFPNITYNCPNQTAALSCGGVALVVTGTFTVASTGTTGTLQFATTQTYNFNINNLTQTGGIIDLGGNTTSVQSANISGTFNQTGGLLKASNTTGTSTLNFAGTTGMQNANFNSAAPAGRVTYRISNGSGINLTGSGGLSSFALNAGGGVRVSTMAVNPLNTTLTLSYGATTTLTYDTAGNYPMTQNIFPATNGPASLTINVGAGNAVTMPFSRTLSGTLTFTSGDLNVGANALTIGTSATVAGAIAGTGNVRLTTGSLTRWFATGALPTTAGTGVGYFPISNGLSNRNVSIYGNGTVATGGTITVSHTGNTGLATGLSVADGAYTINNRTNAFWTFTTNGLALTGGVTLGVKATGAYLFNPINVANLRLMQAAAVPGTYVAGSGTAPIVSAERTGLLLSDLTAGNFYIGAATADMGGIWTATTTGNWNTAGTWDVGTVPTITSLTAINPGVTVTIDAASNAKSLVVNGTLVDNANTLTVDSALANNGTMNLSGGTVTVNGTGGANGITNNAVLNMTGGTLTLGPSGGSDKPFTNGGTLTVSSGTLNINGYFNSTLNSFLNQTGGNINVDGNAAGVLANSVPTGTAIVSLKTSNLNMTGGTFTVVDPHAGVATNTFEYNVSGTVHANLGVNHTFRMGNGASTDAGGDAAYAFRINPDAATSTPGKLAFGNLVINSGAGINSFVNGPSTGTFNAPQYISVQGNLTVNNGAELRTSPITTSTPVNYLSSFNYVVVSGNLLVNTGGTYSTVGITYFASYINGALGASTNTAQTVTNLGTIRNNDGLHIPGFTANFFSVTVQNPNGVTFNSDLSFSNAIAFTAVNSVPSRIYVASGKTFAEHSAQGLGGGASQTAGWVVGRYDKPITTGIGLNGVTYPIGDSTTYAPVTINGSVGTSGDITVSTTKGNHPNIASGNFDPLKTAKRYYTISTPVGVVAGPLTVNFDYQNSDLGIGANPASFIVGQYANGTWTYPTLGALSFTSPLNIQQITGATVATIAGDYQVGQACAPTNITTQPAAQAVCIGVTATFSVTATGSGLTYQWQKNNVNIPLATGATFSIAAPTALDNGSYTVVISSSCAAPVTSTAATLTASSAPPPITTQPLTQTVCSGTTLNLNVTATGNGLTYQWRKAGSNIGTPTTTSAFSIANVSSTDMGSYDVLISNTCGGITTSNPSIVTVNTSPLAAATASGATTFCAGDSVTLTATTGAYTYKWQQNGINITTNGTNYTYVAKTSGSYTAVVTSSANNCFSTTTAITVVSNALPSAVVSAAGPSTICNGDTVTLNTSTGANLSYQWKQGANIVPNGSGASLPVTTSGSYTVKVTDNSVNCSATTTTPLVVTVNPVPSDTIKTTTSTTLCQNDSVVLHGDATAGNTYQWQQAGGNILDTNAAYTAKTSGSYNVVITNTFNCTTTTMPVNVVVNPIPSSVITPSGPTTFCDGDSVTLNANTGTGLTYQWKVNSTAITGATTPSFTTKLDGVYTIVITNTFNCAITSAQWHIGVNPLPVPPIHANGMDLNTNIYFTYQWYANGSAVTGADSINYMAPGAGVYSVQVTDGNGCSGMSALDTLQNSAVANVSGDNNIRIYPNPSSALVHIDAPYKVNVIISDLGGKTVLSKENATVVDLGELANGVYMIRISDQKGSVVKIDKLIKAGN